MFINILKHPYISQVKFCGKWQK